MPSLKDLKVRIGSVKSTQKITAAMKMVAAAKLRRAQEQAESARSYGLRIDQIMNRLSDSMVSDASSPALLRGTGCSDTHLLIPIAADRGLCGGFNSVIIRETRKQISALHAAGNTVKLLCIGRKSHDALRRDYPSLIIETVQDMQKSPLTYAIAQEIAQNILARFAAGEFDVCTVIFNRFQSALTQIVTPKQLIPHIRAADTKEPTALVKGQAEKTSIAFYEFEPDEETLLSQLLPRNLAIQIFQSLLEATASEHAARMTAMDNATRNAGDMIDRLTLQYNRSRQAAITTELIEIISGAEAV